MVAETKKEVVEETTSKVIENPKVETVKVESVASNDSSKAKTNTAGPQPKDIIIDLSVSSRLEIISTSTAEKNQMIVNTGKISLTRGQSYKIPITNKSLNYDTSYVVKVAKDLRTHIQILDVGDGTVTISPMVHNTIIKSGDKIGIML